MKIELLPPQEGELMLVADRAYAMATELVIDSPEMAEAAAEELRAVARRKDELDKQRKEFTGPLDDLKKKIMDLFRRPIDRLAEAEGVLKRALLNWNAEQEAKRRAEEERRQKEAEAERRRLEEIAAAQRKEAEALAAQGNAVEAEAAIAVAEHTEVMSAMVVAPPASIEPPKVAGTSVRVTPEPVVLDKVALLKHVAAHPELAGLFDVNMTAVRGMAKTLGIGSAALPGVVIRAKETLATRRS